MFNMFAQAALKISIWGTFLLSFPSKQPPNPIFHKMWSKVPLNLQGCPPFFSIFAQQTKRTKHIVILGLWQKRLKITIVRLWNVVSAREFDWQFYDQRWSKGLKSRPINCEQKNWRRELATYYVVKIVLKLEFEIWEMENFKELIQILRSSEPEWIFF